MKLKKATTKAVVTAKKTLICVEQPRTHDIIDKKKRIIVTQLLDIRLVAVATYTTAFGLHKNVVVKEDTESEGEVCVCV